MAETSKGSLISVEGTGQAGMKPEDLASKVAQLLLEEVMKVLTKLLVSLPLTTCREDVWIPLISL